MLEQLIVVVNSNATELWSAQLRETGMKTATAVKHVVLDFDGTCTQIPKIWETYLELYFKALPEAGFNISSIEWSEACDAVRNHSPKAAWTLAGCAAAPAAADPYILADEAMRLILRRRGDRRPVPPEIHAKAYGAAPAPWREEALDTFAKLIDRGLRLHFVSNSSTVVITGRLQDLLANHSSLAGGFQCRATLENFASANWTGTKKCRRYRRQPRSDLERCQLPGTAVKSPMPSDVPSI